MKWKEQFQFSEERRKKGSLHHDESMEVPDKPMIEGSRYRSSSREFDY